MTSDFWVGGGEQNDPQKSDVIGKKSSDVLNSAISAKNALEKYFPKNASWNSEASWTDFYS